MGDAIGIGLRYAGGMSPEEKARLKALIDSPPPGSKIEAAKKAGFDLYMNLRRLAMTPTERMRDLQSAVNSMQKMREGMRKAK